MVLQEWPRKSYVYHHMNTFPTIDKTVVWGFGRNLVGA